MHGAEDRPDLLLGRQMTLDNSATRPLTDDTRRARCSESRMQRRSPRVTTSPAPAEDRRGPVLGPPPWLRQRGHEPDDGCRARERCRAIRQLHGLRADG